MIVNPAVGALLPVLAGVISGTVPDIVPAEAVLAQSLDAPQSLTIEGPTTVEFPENSTAAIATYQVEGAVPDSEISWSIDGTDAKRLSIDDSGVLRFGAAKNFERPNDGNRDNEYEIELSAAAGSALVSVEVIVRVTNINESPTFELESAEFLVEENASANRRVGGALVVIDPDDGDSTTFSVEGENADLFRIDAEGQIRVRRGAVLDYETSKALRITALVTDQDGLSDSLPVLITLTDADDLGIVNFLSAKPFVGVPFIATVSDQDGVTGRIRWRWHRGMNSNDEFERIDGAIRSSYTPVDADEGYILRVTVSYEDNFEVKASASGISAAVGRNAAPHFQSASITLTVPEEALPQTDVGDPVSATDSDDEKLAYALSGEDATYFEINDSTGQISVGAQALPDLETKANYTVIVTAKDEAGAAASITVIITPRVSNAPPVITGSTIISYGENDTASVATYSVADPDGDAITWDVAGPDAAWFSISATGALTFNSPPDFEGPNDANKDKVYKVTVTASDGNLRAELDVEVTVTNVNEFPLIEGPTSITYPENSVTTVANYSATDPDGDEITWYVTGMDAASFEISAMGEVSFKSQPDYEEPGDANGDNVYRVTATASDGGLESMLDVEVTVTDVAESILITGPSIVSYAENDTASVATYKAADPNGEGITWDITGVDVARFAIDEAGELSFNSPPDYEKPRDANKDNTYEVTTIASDGSLEATLDIAVTVVNINEAVLITGPATVSYTENDITSVATYSALDPDGDGITWGTGGVDAARFSIKITGELTFSSAPDYENPNDANNDNIYEVTITASDGDLDSTLDVRIAVSDVNEAILITGPAIVTYEENGMATVAKYVAMDPEGDEVTWDIMGADAAGFAIDVTGKLSFNSPPDYEKPRDSDTDNVYELTVTASEGNHESTLDVEVAVTDVAEVILITGPSSVSYIENETASVATYKATDPNRDGITWDIAGIDAARFAIDVTGKLSFNSPPDYEKPRDSDTDNVYELAVTASDESLTVELDIRITVNDVNEAAAITGSTSVTYPENHTNSVATYSATDPDGDAITWGIKGTDAGRFSISATGELTFNSSPDYEDPNDANRDNVYEMTVMASDGSLTAELNIETTVNDINEAASITGSTSISYSENDTTVVAVYSATDPDGDSITWDVEGADAASFVIDNQGRLTFVTPPNFENPFDADTDNAYLFRIVVNDGRNESSLGVVVQVKDANDAPRFPSKAIVTMIPENSCPGAHTLYKGIGDGVASEMDEDGDLLVYALSGQDEQIFVIHPPTGYVTLGPSTSLDFETLRDPFELRVSVSDGRDDLGNTESEFNADDHLNLTVMVGDVNEPPVFTEAQLILDGCGIPVRHEPAQLRREVTAGVSGGSRVGAALSAIDPERKSVHFRIVSQSDQGAFIMDSKTGQIMVAPSFSPRDARRVYTLRVAAMDGELESHIEVRIAVMKAPRPTPEPDVDDPPPPRVESANDVEVATPVQSDETSGDSSLLGGDARNSASSSKILDYPSVRLRRVEPTFVPVPRATQAQLFDGPEVQDQRGRARFIALAGTLAVPYQVRLTQDEAACIPPNETASLLDCICVSIEFFDVAGEPMRLESLNRPALLEIVLAAQDGVGIAENGDERAEISHDSVELIMRQSDAQEWEHTHADLRKPADGSLILMVRVRSPGQYMALVTESRSEKEDPGRAAPLNLLKVTDIQQTQKTVKKSAVKPTVPFVYEPVAAHIESEPVPLVSAEPRAWYMARLLIALLLDVMVVISAGFLVQRFVFRWY